ncbi:hypothetical protein TI39_contig4106g00007 [Zymoseptoria brevis]|uniref:Apple domain-containing protein n=1 Tax=Zymoseptoria brevis TaxID=1047168 RepID=A0A0F4GDY3_9PEZI|nr:hypothetical protein TI39_contig4106g00007 [Zymoseptoria brevis]
MTTASPTGTLAPGIYIFGGTAFRAVVGGNTVTYTSDGQFLISTSGGITTTFTSGGITTTVFGPEPTGDVPVPVAEAVIGQCPTYDDRLLTTAGVDFVSYIVTCGRTYNGTVISTLARRTIWVRAESDDCTDHCLGISGCTAFSYTQDQCIFYSEINAVLVSANPAFSAVRLFNGAEQIVLPNENSTTSAAPSTTLLPSASSVQQISAEFSSQSFVSITGFGTSESSTSMSGRSISVNSTVSACELKGSMARQYNDLSPTLGFDSAVRSSGPDGVAGRSPLITNGDFSTGSLNPWVVSTQESASLSLAQNSASILITNGIGNLGMWQEMTVGGGAAFYVTASLSISGFANFASGSCSMDLITDGQDITFEWWAGLPQTTYHASGHINDFGTFLLLQLSCRLQSGSTVGNITIVADDISFYTYPRAIGASPIVSEPVISNAYYDFANPGTQLITIRRLREDVRYIASATLQVNGPDSDSGTTCTVLMAFEIDGGTQQFFVQEFPTNDAFSLDVQGRLGQDSSAFSIQFVCSTPDGAPVSGVLAVREFDLRIDA